MTGGRRERSGSVAASFLFGAGLLFFLFYVEAAVGEGAGGGSIRGKIFWRGPTPKDEVGDNTATRRVLFAVNPSNQGLKDAVVYLLDEDGGSPGGGEVKLPPLSRAAVINQSYDTFAPHVTAIPAGSSVRFTNEDVANHNVRAETKNPRNAFNVVVTPGQEYAKRFQAELDYSPIPLACDIHGWMRAWIYVFDHPYFGISDGKGLFSISEIPAGRYRLVIHQPDGRLGAEIILSVAGGLETKVSVTFSQDHLWGRSSPEIVPEKTSEEES